MAAALYSIGTWDTDLQAYTPQVRVSARAGLRKDRGSGVDSGRDPNRKRGHDVNDLDMHLDGQQFDLFISVYEKLQAALARNGTE